MFSKLDIKDGFWHMVVSEEDAWNFCYVLPPADGKQPNLDDIELVVPKSLQMGWCKLPPFFCTASEMAQDVIEHLLHTATYLPPHKFEHHMMPNQITPSATDVITTLVEVFVDDFIGATNYINPNYLRRLSQCMLHGIHSVFPPTEVLHKEQADSVAETKLEKGDRLWAYEKEILGWVFCGKMFTIRPPQEKCDCILDRLHKIRKFKSKIPKKVLESLAGKLQHASFALPGGASLFLPIQQALATTSNWIQVTALLSDTFKDWGAIIKHMQTMPTCVLQLVTNLPAYVSYLDSCRIGTGRAWTSGLHEIKPTIWQIRWPDDICSDPNGYCATARMTSAHFGESRTKYPLDTHSTIVSLIV